ncbi:uncharacterized protein METZ01_LOCUS374308 [marine metagenome]|uniref:Uncharacterized protein n=1 Tax=marine metagenome TaxID=408172 RepID=A0A382TH72_9ZZZZ
MELHAQRTECGNYHLENDSRATGINMNRRIQRGKI